MARPPYAIAYAGDGLSRIDDTAGAHAAGGTWIEPGDDWGAAAAAHLAGMDGAERAAWLAVFDHARSGTGPRPPARWRETARQQVAAMGERRFAAGVIAWFDLLGLPSRNET